MSRKRLTCKDQIDLQLSKVKNITGEIPQSLIIDIFFKFNLKDRIDAYIGSRILYNLKSAFIKLVTFGFIPESQDQENSTLFNRTFNLTTSGNIKPGYFYIIRIYYNNEIYEYILIRLKDGSRYIYSIDSVISVEKFKLKHFIKDVDVNHIIIKGASRPIPFTYIDDYIQVFRDLESALDLSGVPECQELVDLVEIFVRTMNLRFDNYQMRMNLIPKIVIESEAESGRTTKFRKLEEFKEYSRMIEKAKNIHSYNFIYEALVNLDENILSYSIQYIIDNISNIIPINTRKFNISDIDTVNIMIAIIKMNMGRDLTYKSPDQHRNITFLTYIIEFIESYNIDKHKLHILIDKYYTKYRHHGVFSIVEIRHYIMVYDIVKQNKRLLQLFGNYMIHTPVSDISGDDTVFPNNLEFLIFIYKTDRYYDDNTLSLIGNLRITLNFK